MGHGKRTEVAKKKTDSKTKGQKERLKSKGEYLYKRYFFNSSDVIRYVCDQYNAGEPIDDAQCKVVFDCEEADMGFLLDLIMYYPKKLQELHLITADIVGELTDLYGETIAILKECRRPGVVSVRVNIYQRSWESAKGRQLEHTISAEDIILTRYCPFLNIELDYRKTYVANDCASIDRIDSSRGYVPGNIQLISTLANRMKNDATREQLRVFATNVLQLYGSPL
jgi:hypothetical protein